MPQCGPGNNPHRDPNYSIESAMDNTSEKTNYYKCAMSLKGMT